VVNCGKIAITLIDGDFERYGLITSMWAPLPIVLRLSPSDQSMPARASGLPVVGSTVVCNLTS
jgi:hypothetical protein